MYESPYVEGDSLQGRILLGGLCPPGGALRPPVLLTLAKARLYAAANLDVGTAISPLGPLGGKVGAKRPRRALPAKAASPIPTTRGRSLVSPFKATEMNSPTARSRHAFFLRKAIIFQRSLSLSPNRSASRTSLCVLSARRRVSHESGSQECRLPRDNASYVALNPGLDLILSASHFLRMLSLVTALYLFRVNVVDAHLSFS
jgi:hypothetical protein